MKKGQKNITTCGPAFRDFSFAFLTRGIVILSREYFALFVGQNEIGKIRIRVTNNMYGICFGV